MRITTHWNPPRTTDMDSSGSGLDEYCIELDEPIDSKKRVGEGSYGASSMDTLCECMPKSMNMMSSLSNKRRESAEKVVEKLRSDASTFQLHRQAEVTWLVKTHSLSITC